jgi:hypothetical protein
MAIEITYNSITKFASENEQKLNLNNYHHNLKFEQTIFKSQKNKDTSTNTKEINP